MKKALENLRDNPHFEEDDVLEECTVLEVCANASLESAVQNEGRLMVEANLLTLTHKIEELFAWITEQVTHVTFYSFSTSSVRISFTVSSPNTYFLKKSCPISIWTLVLVSSTLAFFYQIAVFCSKYESVLR